jgi:hypothetical protein
MEDFFIVLVIFGTLFGIFYLYFTTRNKERLALIEKGTEASIFKTEGPKLPVWKIIIINLSMLSIGAGIGVIVGAIFENTGGFDDDIVYTAAIFIFCGLGLLGGYFITLKAENKD